MTDRAYSVQLADANTMLTELAKITPVETSALVAKTAGKELTVIELYYFALGFAQENNVKVRHLLFFRRSATYDIMKAMVIPEQHGRLLRFSFDMGKRLLKAQKTK